MLTKLMRKVANLENRSEEITYSAEERNRHMENRTEPFRKWRIVRGKSSDKCQNLKMTRQDLREATLKDIRENAGALALLVIKPLSKTVQIQKHGSETG